MTDVHLHVVRSATRAEPPPVLLVHGYSSNHGDWRFTGWTGALERAGREWLALDMRGHGASDKPHDPEAYRPEEFVADLCRVLDAVEAEHADVIGYSLGAELSLELALAHPDRVRRLVLGGIGAQRPVAGNDAETLYRHVVEGKPPPGGPALTLWTRASARPGNDPLALAACLAGISGARPITGLDRYPGPALLFAGTVDPVAAGVEQVVAGLPDAELLWIEGCDHATAKPAPLAQERAIEFLSSEMITAEVST